MAVPTNRRLRFDHFDLWLSGIHNHVYALVHNRRSDVITLGPLAFKPDKITLSPLQNANERNRAIFEGKQVVALTSLDSNLLNAYIKAVYDGTQARALDHLKAEGHYKVLTWHVIEIPPEMTEQIKNSD